MEGPQPVAASRGLPWLWRVGGLGGAGAVAVLFQILLALWVRLWAGDVPDHEQKDAIRSGLMFCLFLVWVDGGTIALWLRRRPTDRLLARWVAVGLTALGGFLFLVLLPQESLSNAGGVTPNLGHTLTVDVELGPLAVFALWSAPAYGFAARWRNTAWPRPRLATDLAVVLFPAAYLAVYAAISELEKITESPVSATSGIVVSSIGGLVAAGAAWAWERRRPKSATPSS